MNSSDLKLKISPQLKEAMNLSANGEGVDYFALFGLQRSTSAMETLESIVMERSKQLRRWQSSPQYGEEAVELLKTLHRAAKILQDERRRQAYLEALERAESGAQVSAEDEFRDLVRAALVDSEISPEARRALNEYIQIRKLDPRLAQQITQQVRGELKAQRAAAVAPDGDNWEFRIKESGVEGYGLMLMGLAQSGKLRDMTAGQLLSEAQKYGITPEYATQLITQYKVREYETLVRIVAGNRALSTAQAKLLADKAPLYGLNQQQASHIIAEYTFTVHDPESILGNLKLAETFDQEEISQIIEQGSGRQIGRSRWSILKLAPPIWMQGLIKLVALLVLVGGIGLWIKSAFFENSTSGPIANKSWLEKLRSQPISTNDNENANHPKEVTSTPLPMLPVATPESTPQTGGQLVSLPDPVSGFITLKSEKPADPPLFNLAITETTNAQYQRYLQATLDAPPSNWVNGKPAARTEDQPVTQVSYDQAIRFCRWFASLPEQAKYEIALPSIAEYRRALRGRTLRGISPEEAGYFGRARLGTGKGPGVSKQTIWDKVFISGEGQIYDLIGNAAEWGRETRGGQHAILGGDFMQVESNFNHLEPRWVPADTSLGSLGFRLVRHLK